MAKKSEKAEPASPKAKASAPKKAVAPKAAASPKVKAGKPKKAGEIAMGMKPVEVYSRFTDFDIGLFQSGKHYKLYEKLGAHVVEHNGVVGTYFAVWAPNAQHVSVIANFNGWNRGSHPLYVRWD
ncbi:MAG: 1,4-alpha-glucan branching protein GlgB, partial [Bacteroidota bacterium]|nr:1,4-alpha-glucan branching protein GlgB [Bacteroidota bacterium]